MAATRRSRSPIVRARHEGAARAVWLIVHARLWRFVPAEELCRVAGISEHDLIDGAHDNDRHITDTAAEANARREGAARAVLAVIAQHFHPVVPGRMICRIAGVDERDVREQIDRLPRRQPPPQLVRPVPTATIPQPGPPPRAGLRWCSLGGHWCRPDDMGRNATRPDGLSDWCHDCWRDYWRARRAADRD